MNPDLANLIIRITLFHVIEHLKEVEPKRTLTARKLVMKGLLEAERNNATIH